jgi:hypothetical protein
MDRSDPAPIFSMSFTREAAPPIENAQAQKLMQQAMEMAKEAQTNTMSDPGQATSTRLDQIMTTVMENNQH